jgi:hypothetical protein
MTVPLANSAFDAGRLLGFALRSQNPLTSKDYSELLRRYDDDTVMRTITDSVCDGLGLRVVYVGKHGMVLTPTDASPFRLTAEDYRSGMSSEERMLHGLVQVAVAAYSFPRAETLAQDDDVQPALITAQKLAEYLREFGESEQRNLTATPDHVATEERRLWREVLVQALTKETSRKRESPKSLTGMCRYALEFLAKQGLMRVVDDKKGVYQGTSAFRIRLKYHSGHALLEQMRQVVANDKGTSLMSRGI